MTEGVLTDDASDLVVVDSHSHAAQEVRSTSGRGAGGGDWFSLGVRVVVGET
jgi:hypothetical protein